MEVGCVLHKTHRCQPNARSSVSPATSLFSSTAYFGARVAQIKSAVCFSANSPKLKSAPALYRSALLANRFEQTNYGLVGVVVGAGFAAAGFAGVAPAFTG